MKKTDKITGVLICPDKGTAEKKTIGNDLHDWYAELDCELVDIPERTIGGKYFDIICDDEGLLKADPYISAIDANYQPMLVGRLFVCHHDNAGNMTSLTDDECVHVLKHCRLLATNLHPTPYRMLTDVGY